MPNPSPLKLLITAGPTREPIDAVRFVSNRSSGKLGLALAGAAAGAGHRVTLLLGPVSHEPEPAANLAVHRFESAADLEKLLQTHLPKHDVLVMAAAVADYRPVRPAAGKLPSDKQNRLTLELEPTPDLVRHCADIRRPQQRIIAFSLEQPEQLEARARRKLSRKAVDAIVANPLETMDADTISALWLDASGGRQASGRLSKADFATWLLSRIEHLVPRDGP